MSRIPPLYLGQNLATQTGKASCRLGLVVEDRDGRRYGLTARHVLESEPDERIYDAETGVLVGRRLPHDRWTHVEGAFTSTVGAFGIEDSDGTPGGASVQWMVRSVVDPRDVVGAGVWRMDRPSDGPRGIVRFVGGSVEVRRGPGGTPRLLHDVVEVSFGTAAPSVGAGQAGSLILTEDRRAVGLAMVGSSGICYCAPLRPFMALNGLSLPRGRVPSTMHDLDVDMHEEVPADLRQATTGVSRMLEEARREMPDSKDPAGEPLSDELLQLIEMD